MIAPSPDGERFGRYLLLELIGRGGMAEVYRAAVQGIAGFQRVFVIKRILREKSASPEFVEMFINEARISAVLNHPNIVQIYDFGQIDGSYFLAMEHLRGKDLLTVLRQLRALGRRMAPEVAAYVAHHVALGLDYAHHLTQAGNRLDIIHRDVSPSNIMLLRAGGVKLLDFGIAKATMEVRADSETGAGMVKGKLSYVSPEQIRGASQIDGRADVFALGVVLWESLTGKRLFFDRNDFQTMRNVLERPVPPPSTQRAEVPAALDFMVLRALERDPERRYPSAKMMAEELEVFLQDARFVPRAMTRMLDEIFGEEYPHLEVLPTPAPIPTQATPPTAPARSLEPIDIEADSSGVPLPFDEEESYTSVSSVHRLPVQRRPPPRPWFTAAFGVALAAAVVALVVDSRPMRIPLEALGESPPSSSMGRRAASPRPRTAIPVQVTATIDSDPQGAEIRGERGEVLGITPLALPLPRSEEPWVVTLVKPGYLSDRQSIFPDRDLSITFTLRPDPAVESAERSQRARR